MDVVALGINFKTAPLELREQLSYSACKARNALHRLQDEFADTEVMLLSTCNRTELYAASDRELNVNSIARAFVSNGSGPHPELERHLYIKRRKEATEHLMRVATSDGISQASCDVALTVSNQPTRRARPVTVPNSRPRSAMPRPMSSTSSVGNGPEPTRVA